MTSAMDGPDDSALDELDLGRDETAYFDGLDDFIETLEGKNVVRIKSLEKNLENEKRRLATMEIALIEARKQKQNEMRIIGVTKQATILNGMMEVLKTMTSREIEAKQDWDSQWREKFSEFRQQHLDMEAALKRRHVEELKKLQDEIREEVRAVAVQAKDSQGKSMPSPRSIQKIQDKNMQRVVTLFHKHAQERLYLASKISQQEELLIRAKNRSLQEKISQVQTKSNRFCGKLHSTGLQQIKRMQIEAGEDLSGDVDGSSPSLKKTVRMTGLIQDSQISRINQQQLSNSSISLSSAASATLPVGSSTFVTEMDYEPEPATRTSSHLRSIASWTQKSKGSISAESAISEQNLHDFAPQDSRTHGESSRGLGVNSTSFPQKMLDGQMATSFPQHTGSKVSAFGEPGMQPSQLTNNFPGQEFTPWAPPTSSIMKGDGKPVWNSHPSKWNPNVIAIESSITSSSKHTFSPYATFAVGDRTAEKGPPVKGSSYSARSSRKSKSSQKDASRSASARSFTLPRDPHPSARPIQRSISTEPRLENAKGRKGTPDSSRAKTTLPQITDRNSKQQSTDPNFNRPKADPGTGDEFPNAAEKFSKLESWIEEKIRDVLGNGSTKAAILANQLASSAMSHLQQSSEGEDDEPQRNASRRSDDRGGSAVGMRDVDSRGVRELNSRGQVLSMQPRSHSSISDSSLGRSGEFAAGGAGSRTGDSNVGSFMSRLRSGMADAADLNSSNQGLRLESRAGSEPAAPTAASINAALHPVRTRDRREVRQGGDDDDEAGGRGAAAGLGESQELIDRRERFDRVSSGSSLRSVGGGDAAAARAAAAAAGLAGAPRASKRVGWNLSPRESEADAGSDGGTDAAQRLGTAASAPAGHELSRPGTRTSSRPDTSTSSFFGDDDDDGPAAAAAAAAAAGPSDGSPGGGGGGEPSEGDVRDFFSKIRHNKVAECEEALGGGGMRADVRDPHGNTPLLVAAQNGHKRLVKLLLKAGADPDATNHQGNTALHFATSYGYQSLANYLVSKGADDTLMNMKGLTCYDGLG